MNKFTIGKTPSNDIVISDDETDDIYSFSNHLIKNHQIDNFDLATQIVLLNNLKTLILL